MLATLCAYSLLVFLAHHHCFESNQVGKLCRRREAETFTFVHENSNVHELVHIPAPGGDLLGTEIITKYKTEIAHKSPIMTN